MEYSKKDTENMRRIDGIASYKNARMSEAAENMRN